MPRAAEAIGFIGGGLLKGIGTGIQEDGKAKRAAYLKNLEISARGAEKAKDRELTVSEGEKNRASKERIAKLKDTSGGLLAGDKRIFDVIKSRHTVKEVMGEKTDWDAVARDLKSNGRPDLARIAQPGGAGGIDVNSDTYERAKEMANAEASDKAGWRTTDEEDFADYGGSRAAFINKRTVEIYKQLQGGGGGPEPRAPQPPDTAIASEPKTGERPAKGEAADAETLIKNLADRGFGAASSVGQTKKHPKTGKEYPVIAKGSKEYEVLPIGKTYFDPEKQKFFKKGKAPGSGGREATLIKQAREAIQNKADPEAVKKRLRELGIDPNKL